MQKVNKTFDEFMAVVKGIKPKIQINIGDPNVKGYYREVRKDKDTTPYIYSEWSTGGVSGGSCWDTGETDSHRSYSGELPKELTALDAILEEVSPNITYLQYKSLANDVVEYSTRTEDEYYGNSSNYAMKKCSLIKLYNALITRNMF